MKKLKYSKLTECLKKRPVITMLLFPCVLILTLYYVSNKYLVLDDLPEYKIANNPEEEIVDGYLVWNSKCHMLSYNPMDSSIRKFVWKRKFEACSTYPLLTFIAKDANDTFSIVINSEAAKNYHNFQCCWSSIERVQPSHPPTGEWDTNIKVGPCENFEKQAVLPSEIEIILVTCKSKSHPKKKKPSTVYENIHAIVNPAKVQEQINVTEESRNDDSPDNKKISVLVLGLDSVSRLNFLRSMPRTEKYLRNTGWFHLKGYNKMGDNTFPNLMAILTGQNSTSAYSNCKPKEAYGLDNCPFLWNNFKKAGYITAYGEDDAHLSTFNYLKVGFVDPPTNYYLRPYVWATEKLLKAKYKYNAKYCTGPELAIDRIYNYAVEFAQTFLDLPYFAFFWTNTVTHNDVNGISSLDDYFLKKLKKLEKIGVFNNTLVIFLSDHGMRWGEIRNTFVGWYEERLPFLYLRIPDWLREDSKVVQALKSNEHRLTSPYDIYETFRDILTHVGGEAFPSSGCPKCQSLFQPVPVERSCEDAGISPHWCTCTGFLPEDPESKVALAGAQTFIDYIENVIKDFKDKKGRRICAKLKLKRIYRVDKILNLDNITIADDVEKYSYLIELSPGGGLFETTVEIDKDGRSRMSEEEVSRINSYAKDAKCLDNGFKKYCYCLG
ncbi:uncharacterized protein [Chelonus insularis]|uniref:uncharacterized protein n=1 Tax=Chelonus insularis TaxID=460826 RepID=UPI001589146A|nr:uncharacterized protein LOC118073284 [Chelonus insularis]XP_034949581.1 uncharacterized protein LOC118073284 [Chelonus insularis]XP_034949582.1 uncharacterized protein LOC118073284 [Chelonus insularis]XP_034949583.1 uncharacterized protein LOC118073284 [Chelonus insularis]XP_034949584.1 uncharacterized protein LOC118073284 [Chelonus insularis]XP_034949585.1 uncharacterized protein LOC118073284 [Chelonus insularis]XP_034949586.1 uncharacterized protein LOC118073284 [Chelonus insularis]